MSMKLRLWVSLCLVWIFYSCGNEDIPSESNYAPKISIFEVESDIVGPGQEISISLKAVDLEGDPITYKWQANGGLIHGDENGAVWVAQVHSRNYCK